MLITNPHKSLIGESSKARELSTKALLITAGGEGVERNGRTFIEHPLSVSVGKQTSKSVLRCHSLSSEDKEGVKPNLKDIFLYNYIGRLDLSKSAFIIGLLYKSNHIMVVLCLCSKLCMFYTRMLN